MKHDVGLEAGHSGKLFVTLWTGGVHNGVSRLVQLEVELHVEGHGALITSVRLLGRADKGDYEKLLCLVWARQHT